MTSTAAVSSADALRRTRRPDSSEMKPGDLRHRAREEADELGLARRCAPSSKLPPG
jgi:hypothetical protein